MGYKGDCRLNTLRRDDLDARFPGVSTRFWASSPPCPDGLRITTLRADGRDA